LTVDTLIQPFDEDGNLLCVACHKLIKRFYVAVNERDDDSVYPSQLVVHTSCLHLLADTPPGLPAGAPRTRST
jgi:hypothetical protein